MLVLLFCDYRQSSEIAIDCSIYRTISSRANFKDIAQVLSGSSTGAILDGKIGGARSSFYRHGRVVFASSIPIAVRIRVGLPQYVGVVRGIAAS